MARKLHGNVMKNVYIHILRFKSVPLIYIFFTFDGNIYLLHMGSLIRSNQPEPPIISRIRLESCPGGYLPDACDHVKVCNSSLNSRALCSV